MCSICGNSADFLLFSMIWFCRIQLPAVSKPRDVRWCGFRWSIFLSIDYVWKTSIHRLCRLIYAYIAYEIDNAKIIAALCPISYCFCMIWYGWIQSSAMFKQQNVLWCGYPWSIPISIDYVWSVYIDRASSTPWYSYCIWNSCIKKSPMVTGVMRETITHAVANIGLDVVIHSYG